MPRSKNQQIVVRATDDLRASFDAAFADHGGLGSRNAFFEDCMRALILAVRQKKKVMVPLEFLERGKLGK